MLYEAGDCGGAMARSCFPSPSFSSRRAHRRLAGFRQSRLGWCAPSTQSNYRADKHPDCVYTLYSARFESPSRRCGSDRRERCPCAQVRSAVQIRVSRPTAVLNELTTPAARARRTSGPRSSTSLPDPSSCVDRRRARLPEFDIITARRPRMAMPRQCLQAR